MYVCGVCGVCGVCVCVCMRACMHVHVCMCNQQEIWEARKQSGETRVCVGVILCIVNGWNGWRYKYLAILPPNRKGNYWWNLNLMVWKSHYDIIMKN